MTAQETDYVYLDIRDALVGVILGDRFPDNFVPDVWEIGASYNAEVVRLKWILRFPSLFREEKRDYRRKGS